MHFPELSLVTGCKYRLGGYMGEVPVFVRVHLHHEPYLSFVVFEQFIDSRTDSHAVGSLVVDKLDHGHRGIGLTISR